jgi:hypothetical protein
LNKKKTIHIGFFFILIGAIITALSAIIDWFYVKQANSGDPHALYWLSLNQDILGIAIIAGLILCAIGAFIINTQT